jgi:hypothetical protein
MATQEPASDQSRIADWLATTDDDNNLADLAQTLGIEVTDHVLININQVLPLKIAEAIMELIEAAGGTVIRSSST